MIKLRAEADTGSIVIHTHPAIKIGFYYICLGAVSTFRTFRRCDLAIVTSAKLSLRGILVKIIL